MKILSIILLSAFAFLLSGCFGVKKPDNANSSVSIYEQNFISITGEKVSLNEFKGKNILFVNVASECGFTKQYADLEKLSRIYKDNLVIIGFPANDFLGQEPGTNEQIAAFCKDNYDVTFLMAEKITVIGKDMHPIYKWLTDKSLNGWNEMKPKWNFYKYIVDTEGELVKVLPSTTEPLDEEITGLLK
jgi:glutathione peroxidase